MPKLFSYQKPHCDLLERALGAHSVALDASDLGTGKTVCACALARRMGLSMIVTGKKIMKPTWAWWMDQWGVSGVVGNWEMARKRGLPNRAGHLYVFDEVHEASGYKTLNAKLLIGVYEAGRPTLMLSATAIQSPLKMWAIGYLLGCHNLKDFYRWGFKNGVVRNFGYPGFHFNGSREVLTRIHHHLFPEWGARMRKAEIPDFPECQFILELVEPAGLEGQLGPWARMIAIREAQHELKMAGQEVGPCYNLGQDILPEILFARMRAELGKVLALIEEAASGIAEGYSVVIFCNFLPTLDALAKLGPPAGMIYGGQDPSERAQTIRLFQENKQRLLLATIDSGGASIDLHDLEGGHPRLALVCPTWRAVALRQALGRVHRAGGKSKSVQKLIYAAGTIEEEIAARVRAKLGDIDQLNDADLAETEFALKKEPPTLAKMGGSCYKTN